MSIKVQSNVVMEEVFNEVSRERCLDRISVQRELLGLCEDESEKRDLLVYLSRTKLVHVADIICDIKTVDKNLAINLRREETLRWEKIQSKRVTALPPLFSTP